MEGQRWGPKLVGRCLRGSLGSTESGADPLLNIPQLWPWVLGTGELVKTITALLWRQFSHSIQVVSFQQRGMSDRTLNIWWLLPYKMLKEMPVNFHINSKISFCFWMPSKCQCFEKQKVRTDEISEKIYFWWGLHDTRCSIIKLIRFFNFKSVTSALCTQL